METKHFDQQLRETTALIIFAGILLATVTRPLLVEMDEMYTVVGGLNSLVMGLVYWAIRSKRVTDSAAGALLMGVSFLCMAPLLYVSGGVNSQFMILLPLMPVTSSFITAPRFTVPYSILLVLMVIILTVLNDYTLDLGTSHQHSAKVVSKAYWSTLAIVVATGLGIYVHRCQAQNRALLSEQAYLDVLTNIPNRRSGELFLQGAIAQAQTSGEWLSVIMLDIDHFKQLNDQYGHACGDRCLKIVADCLSRMIRKDKDFVGRFGGEEFILVLRGVEPDRLRAIGENIRRQIAELSLTSDNKTDISVTATLGGSAFNGQDIEGRDQMLHLADEALYWGKNNGRNRFVYHGDMS